MTNYILSFLLLLSLNTLAQKTTVAIEGISFFKLGDTVTRIKNYGCNFREILFDNDYNFSNKYQSLDSGQTFCSKARVFYCNNLEFDEFEYIQEATLTYYNNKLIDIKLHDIILSDNKITDILKLKYGQSFGKIFLEGYNYNILKLKAKGVKITASIDKQLQEQYLSSIYWTNGNITISVGGSNKTYDFVEKKYKSANEAEAGIRVTDNKEYEKLISCSNLDFEKKLAEHFKRLKQKSSNF